MEGDSLQMDLEPQQLSEITGLLAFKVGDNDYGIDIRQTLRINRLNQITMVYRAPPYVRGIVNLRGQVVTVLDLAVKFGYNKTELTSQSRIIVVRDQDEDIGLLVDRIIDVLPVTPDSLKPPPANLGGVIGHYFTGVHRQESGLIGILDVAVIIEVDS